MLDMFKVDPPQRMLGVKILHYIHQTKHWLESIVWKNLIFFNPVIIYFLNIKYLNHPLFFIKFASNYDTSFFYIVLVPEVMKIDEDATKHGKIKW